MRCMEDFVAIVGENGENLVCTVGEITILVW